MITTECQKCIGCNCYWFKGDDTTKNTIGKCTAKNFNFEMRVHAGISNCLLYPVVKTIVTEVIYKGTSLLLIVS